MPFHLARFARTSICISIWFTAGVFIASAFAQTDYSRTDHDQQPILAHRFRYLKDALTLPDGRAVYLFKNHGVRFWDNENSKFVMRHKYWEKGTREFHKLFRDPFSANNYYALATIKYGEQHRVALYNYSSDHNSVVAMHVDERLRSPTFYQSQNGMIFFTSRTGFVYCFSGDMRDTPKKYTIQLPSGLKHEHRRSYRPIRFTEWPGGPVCIYSIVDPEYKQLALYDLAVADEKGWKTISLGGRATGPACLTSADQLKMLRHDRWINVDLKSGEITEQEFALPTAENVKLKPVELFRTPDGTLISLWRKLFRSFHKYDIDAFDGGCFHKIAVWKKDRWVFEGEKDRQLYKPIHQFADSDGGFWLTSPDGTLHRRRSDGHWQEFDFRHHVAINSIDSIRVEPDNRLWLFHRNGGPYDLKGGQCNLLNLKRMRETKVTDVSSQWKVFYSRRGTNLIVDGGVHPMETFGNKLIIPNNDEFQIVPLPDPGQIQIHGKRRLIDQDRFGGVWLRVYELGKESTYCRFFKGKWTVFPATKLSDGRTLRSSEVAAEKMLELGFNAGDKIFSEVVFGPDRLIAVRNHFRRGVSFFDGSQWYFGQKGQEFKTPPTGIKFDKDSLVVQFQSGTFQRMPRETWNDVDPASWERPWIESNESDEAKHQRLFGMRDKIKQRKENLTKLQKTIPLKDAYWRQNGFSDKLYIAAGDSEMSIFSDVDWVTLSTKGTPFRVDPNLARMGSDQAGRIYFEASSESMYKVYVYDPPPFKLKFETNRAGILSHPEDILSLNWPSDAPLGDLKIQFRVGDENWSNWQPAKQAIKPGAIAPKGRYELEIKLFSKNRLIGNQVYRFPFEVAYDLSAQIDRLIDQLNTDKFTIREKASTQLKNLGPRIHPYLRGKLRTELDLEAWIRLEKIVAGFNLGSGSTPKKR